MPYKSYVDKILKIFDPSSTTIHVYVVFVSQTIIHMHMKEFQELTNKGASLNYVDRFFEIFDTPFPLVDKR